MRRIALPGHGHIWSIHAGVIAAPAQRRLSRVYDAASLVSTDPARLRLAAAFVGTKAAGVGLGVAVRLGMPTDAALKPAAGTRAPHLNQIG
ncbi:hypothetical protein J2Z33_002548 [Rubellimicrobium aerolatum]|nr:hypothetical protein [Rubellimicrobium aerolatum]